MSGKDTEFYQARTKSFARRGRPLHASTQRTWDTHAHKFVIEIPRGDGYTTVDPEYQLDVEAAFGRSAPLIIEVGPGNGEQLISFAAAHPDVNVLGLEVWRQGLAKALSRGVDAGVTNVRLIEVDAAQALPTMVSEGSASEVWTFFPDPWRKARHHKRRLVNDEFALTVARVLADGGLWRLATDWQHYAWQMRNVVEACDHFENPYAGCRPDPDDEFPDRGGFAPRFDGRIVTRFETRGADEGRSAYDIVGVRMPRERL
ncbi:MAG: tRNA (guanosine(46)-N7)-methyltransferase TrmB [Actinomycetaceae bacterium]|nr:tRNA (guanosine(46)-N7)-methyltransferase TrmB [Actinomycetaceae bacterium]